MRISCMAQIGGLVAAGLLLTACGDATEVHFAQPFPANAANVTAFPARHRAVYTALDSSKSLCIGPKAVWRQELQSVMFSRHQLDSLPHSLLTDSTYQQDGHLHYLRLVGRDSVRDSWLSEDTIFTLAGPNAGRLRRFQGRYYLNTPSKPDGCWQVQRLEINGARLSWQTLGQDTLRLLALDTAIVRRYRANNMLYFELAPAPGTQTNRAGRYAGLWEIIDEYKRRR